MDRSCLSALRFFQVLEIISRIIIYIHIRISYARVAKNVMVSTQSATKAFAAQNFALQGMIFQV